MPATTEWMADGTCSASSEGAACTAQRSHLARVGHFVQNVQPLFALCRQDVISHGASSPASRGGRRRVGDVAAAEGLEWRKRLRARRAFPDIIACHVDCVDSESWRDDLTKLRNLVRVCATFRKSSTCRFELKQ